MPTPPVLNEFKEFILKGNAVSLAVGVIIGAAFGKIVTAITAGLIQPIINALGGDPNVSLNLWIFDFGIVINAVISLIITGAVLFFFFVRPMNRLTKKEEVAPTVHPVPSKEEVLLTEIRDLLREKSTPLTSHIRDETTPSPPQ
ncbi:MAG: large conductance mechanosensitive channel protein MscL [Armatimonadetes bacterium]|nr:large conductance mechanosensitive channel protein MscL [Akkermansiaceae bacterium]